MAPIFTGSDLYGNNQGNAKETQMAIKNIPNMLTTLRLILVPVFVLVFYLPFKGNHVIAAIIFALASATDWLDGYLARSLKQTTLFGSFFDPVVDKIIVVTALVLVVGEIQLPYLALPAAVIIGREIIVSALREWMAELGKRAHVSVSAIGKVKTMLQMVAITLLLLYKPTITASIWFGEVGYVLLCVAAVLTLWSMVLYLKAAWPELTR